MIFRLRFKYKSTLYAVITFIVISFLIAIFSTLILRAPCAEEVEPIDVVYTWVNGSDSMLIRGLINISNPLTKRSLLDKFKPRFYDRHELRFSLRSLEKYAPWVRNVYIVTNGQIPYWLNLDHERLFLIQHKEIFSDLEHLPTFSSPAIESHIHKIPGLSKRFLYFNDDIYLGAPIHLTDFFIKGRGYLIYLDYPLQNCAKDCSWIYVHDGQCDKACNVSACQMDGGDCDQTGKLQDSLHAPERESPIQVTSNLSIILQNNSSQNVTLFVKMESGFEHILANSSPSHTDKSSIKRMVETHNRDKMKSDKLRRKKRKLPQIVFYINAYLESLQHTNRLFNTKYGFRPRHVPAHMPFLIDKDVVERLQATFSKEFAVTSSHPVRSKDDMQFSFSYFNFLLEEKVHIGIDDIFDLFDTDLSGTWSDREIRTVLTRLSEIPLTMASIDQFDELLINCSKIVQPNDVTTPEYERYIDSVLPTISKELVIRCKNLKDILLARFSKKSKYLYEIIKNVSEYVTFEMIGSDIQPAVIKFDRMRKRAKKFVCINDNVYRSYNESTINAIWYDFYLSMFPIPSKFELPNEYRNRFMYLKDLKLYQARMTFYLYCCLLVCTFFILWFVCKQNITHFLNNKVFC